MTWLLIASVAGIALLITSIGGVLACGLGRIAAETDQADRAAWNNWLLTYPSPVTPVSSGVRGTLE